MKRKVELIEDSSGTLSTSTGVDIPTSSVDSYTKTESDSKYLGKTSQAVDADTVDGTHILHMTQAEYDGLGTKDSNTLYIIVG